MYGGLLAPAAVLILWSLVMLVWMSVTRLPAMKKAGIDMAAQPGGRGQNLEGVIPDSVNWKAHNYAHLMEQPTLFYAVTIILALLGEASASTLALAWAYVALRILHSIWQATINHVPVRFLLFLASTICLLVLSITAVIAVFSGGLA